MQMTGEDLVRASLFVEAHHGSDSAATVGAPANINSGAADRAAWVRVSQNGRIATAPNTPRPTSVPSIIGNEPISNETRSEIEHIVHETESVSDVREGIVASLRERIESGTYFVDSETIAEMMIRRTVADQLR